MKKYKLWALMQVVILLVGSVSCSKDENDEPTLKNDITKDGIFNGLPNDEMVLVKGGTFTMGATSQQGTSDPDEVRLNYGISPDARYGDIGFRLVCQK